jgi:hypothetical protein
MAKNRLKASIQSRSPNKQSRPDDFASVAKRLGCDPDMAKFDAKLKKIAKAKGKGHAGRK